MVMTQWGDDVVQPIEYKIRTPVAPPINLSVTPCGEKSLSLKIRKSGLQGLVMKI
jgi:hypothetical protein